MIDVSIAQSTYLTSLPVLSIIIYILLKKNI